MPIVNQKSDLFRDAFNGGGIVDPKRLRGRADIATGSVANLATDLNTSSYHLIDLPSDCLIHPDTAFDVENWGFATINLGTQGDIDALGTIPKASGATYRPVVFGDAKFLLELWQILGLATDPGGFIGIYAHASANATAAGAMLFQIQTIRVT